MNVANERLSCYKRGFDMRLKERAKRLKCDIPVVFLALKDKRTPIFAKVFAAITVIYALSPIDLIPDFIPVLGYLDDIIILPFLIIITIKLIPEQIWKECKSHSENVWKDGKPCKWYYSIPVIVIWGIVLWWIIKVLWF